MRGQSTRRNQAARKSSVIEGNCVMTQTKSMIDSPKIVTSKQWLAARLELLAKEKDFTHQRETLAAARRQMPAVTIKKDYIFDGPGGGVSLRGLFEGRRQLIIYHLMFEPSRKTACKHCSSVMDNIARA